MEIEESVLPDRSDLWCQINFIVRKLKLEKSYGEDSYDHPSITTEIEKLFYIHEAKSMFEAYKQGFDSATDCLAGANKTVQDKKFKID